MNARKKALVGFLESTAEVARVWKKKHCYKCRKEILCFPGSINTTRILNCEHSTKLIRSFVRLVEAGVITVHSNLSLSEIKGID